MIAIVDYGMGNLRSVQKAFEYAGFDAKISEKGRLLNDASHIVLPGVGAFGDAARLIFESGLKDDLEKQIQRGKPLLGICLGMQLLFSESEESDGAQGLGFIEGSVVKFKGKEFSKLKVPHVGWNELEIKKEYPLFAGIGDRMFYFVHGYHVTAPERYVAATTDYGVNFASAVQKENVFGVQFHPEKSGATGQILLKNFGGLR